ncbi:hypothetical protein PG997_008366 [Apiospora hydei]|uniref:Uncharacterized protein n=1 Tax=Apiospora hydei TaxID=1337664 RepID=A0ABR1WAM6_9PEZI
MFRILTAGSLSVIGIILRGWKKAYNATQHHLDLDLDYDDDCDGQPADDFKLHLFINGLPAPSMDEVVPRAVEAGGNTDRFQISGRSYTSHETQTLTCHHWGVADCGPIGSGTWPYEPVAMMIFENEDGEVVAPEIVDGLNDGMK